MELEMVLFKCLVMFGGGIEQNSSIIIKQGDVSKVVTLKQTPNTNKKQCKVDITIVYLGKDSTNTKYKFNVKYNLSEYLSSDDYGYNHITALLCCSDIDVTIYDWKNINDTSLDIDVEVPISDFEGNDPTDYDIWQTGWDYDLSQAEYAEIDLVKDDFIYRLRNNITIGFTKASADFVPKIVSHDYDIDDGTNVTLLIRLGEEGSLSNTYTVPAVAINNNINIISIKFASSLLEANYLELSMIPDNKYDYKVTKQKISSALQVTVTDPTARIIQATVKANHTFFGNVYCRLITSENDISDVLSIPKDGSTRSYTINRTDNEGSASVTLSKDITSQNDCIYSFI